MKKQKAKKKKKTKGACELGDEIAMERQHNNKTEVVAGDPGIIYVKGWELSNAEETYLLSLSQVQL